MKTKIGEKNSKKINGLGGLLKAYPGLGVIAAAIIIGGVGFGAMNMVQLGGDEQVLDNEKPAVEQEVPQEEVKEEQSEEVEEIPAKTTEEAVNEIVSAGAESAEFTAAEEGLTLNVVLKAEAAEEDVNSIDAAVKALLTEAAFVKERLFENTDEKVMKAYSVNYLLGEAEEASYVSSVNYASNESRKGGMIYVAKSAWAGPEKVEVEEETTVLENTPAAPAQNTTPSTNNNTTTNNNAATQAPAQNQGTAANPTTPNTQTELKPTETEAEIAASADSLRSKAKKYHNSINSDIIGWLQIPGTSVDYPVTHTNNNSYYMNYNIYKQWDKNGALLADYECNFNSGLPTNTIIYGHNWNNCWAPFNNRQSYKMFEEVHDYADASFAANHPYIYFSTTEKDYKYKVFAAFYTHVNWTDYIYAYPDNAKLSNVISTAQKNSLHNFGTKASTGDKIITLSTCTRAIDSTGNYRFVVMAKLV